jgi:hypothetical protein
LLTVASCKKQATLHNIIIIIIILITIRTAVYSCVDTRPQTGALAVKKAFALRSIRTEYILISLCVRLHKTAFWMLQCRRHTGFT